MSKQSKKLSIAFLFDDALDSNDGVAQFVKRLGAWLSSQGHEVIYLVGESRLKTWAGGEVWPLSKNLAMRWGGNRLSISLFPRLKLINQLLRQKHFDVVHVQVPYSPFMAQVVINKLPDQTAVIGTVHVFPASGLSIMGSRALRVIYGKSLKRLDQMMSVSSAAQEYAKACFHVDSKIVPNPVELIKFQRPKTQKPTAGQKIVFLGRLVKRKGCAELLRAFAQLADNYSAVSLVIAGDGPERKHLEDLAKRLGVATRADFRGFIKEEQKADLLAGATIACFPSLYGESFGIVLIEAMAAGAGVVLGGDNPGYRTVLQPTPQALFNPRDTSSFAACLERMLSDSKLTRQIHAVQQTQIKKYDIETVGQQVLEVYREAIASRSQSRHN